MAPDKKQQKVYWFAARTRFMNSSWFRWYPINLWGVLAALILVGAYIVCFSLFFIGRHAYNIAGGVTLFILIQAFTAFLMFRKTKALDV